MLRDSLLWSTAAFLGFHFILCSRAYTSAAVLQDMVLSEIQIVPIPLTIKIERSILRLPVFATKAICPGIRLILGLYREGREAGNAPTSSRGHWAS